MQAAFKYQKETDLKALQDVASTYDSETGIANFKNNIVANVEYNMEDEQYTIKFSDGSTAIAKSKEAADFAIATYAKLKNEDIDSGKAVEGEPLSFKLKQNGKVDVEITLKDGKVDVQEVNGSTGSSIDTEKIREQAQAVADEQAAKATENVTG